MKITFVRHGETDWNKKGILQGHTDTSLNENGKAQAALIASSITGEFDAFYTSDLKRAKETAEVIGAAINMTLKENPLLRDIDFGVYSGEPAEVVRKMGVKRDIEYKYENGESFRDILKRLQIFLATCEGENILVVTHLGCMRLLYALFSDDISYEEALKTPIKNTAVLECVEYEGRKSATFISETV